MKKIFVLLAATAFAISSAAASGKQKKLQQTKEAEEIARQHDNTLRVLRDGLPLVLPSWSLPLYFNMNKDQKTAEKTR